MKFGSVEERDRGKCDCESGGTLRKAGGAQLLCHETGDDNRQGLTKYGEQAKANERYAEDRQPDVLDEWREWRVGDESPVEMAGIAEKLEFVAMKAVAAIGEDVEQGNGGGEGEKEWPLGFGPGGGRVGGFGVSD